MKPLESSLMMFALFLPGDRNEHSLFKLPIIIKSLDFYCKERIITPESSDHAFWVSQKEFHNSELIRQ